MSKNFSTFSHTSKLNNLRSLYPLPSSVTETVPLNSRQADTSLLVSLKLVDDRTVTYLFDQHSRLVYSVAFSILRNHHDAQDIVQEVFMQVWKNATPFVSARGSVQAWLTMIARSRSLDALRKRRPTDEIETVQLASQQDLSHDVERNILTERVKHLVADLPVKQQEGIQMAFFEEMSHSEIARKIKRPLGTVKTTIRAALHSVKDAIAVAQSLDIAQPEA